MPAVRTGVIYLQKDKFQFYIPALGRVVEFRFTPEMVRDLDVINSEVLENYIKAFVTNGKISPCSLIFVLSENAYFTKDFVPPAQQKGAAAPTQAVSKEELQKAADEFIEHVPFDNVVSKSVPLKEGIKVVATNKDFYEAIAIAFEHLGFTIESVLPGLVLGNGLSLRPVMDPAMANIILGKTSTLRQYNLLNTQVFQPLVKQETEEVDEIEVDSQQTKKPNKRSMYALVAIAPLLLILGFVLYQQFQAPPPKRASNTGGAQQVAQPTQSVVAVPTTATATTSGNLQTQSLTVQVVGTPGTTSNAQKLQGNLDTLGFKSVILQTSSSVGSSSTLVSFSPDVHQDIRDAVLSEVKKFATNVTVQEKQGSYDISVVLGQ